jgi:hypothetical protein
MIFYRGLGRRKKLRQFIVEEKPLWVCSRTALLISRSESDIIRWYYLYFIDALNVIWQVDLLAQKGKATAVIVCEETNTTLPRILVQDTRLALGQLGAYVKKQIIGLKSVAITGFKINNDLTSNFVIGKLGLYANHHGCILTKHFQSTV